MTLRRLRIPILALSAGALVAAGWLLLARASRSEPDLQKLTLAQLRDLSARRPRETTLVVFVQRLSQEGELKEALRVATDAVKRFPESSAVQNALGIAQVQNDDAEAGRAAFRRAIALNPRSVHAYVNLGRLALLVGDHQSALAEFDRATAVDPNSAGAWTGVGQAAAELHHQAQARDAFENAIRLAPERPEAHAGYGCFLAEQENGKQARQYLHRALSLGERSGKVYASLAIAYADQPEGPQDLQQALKYGEDATRLGDDSSLLHYARGLALQRLGRYREAIAAYRKVINQNITANGAWIGMSQCYRALGKRDIADKAAVMGERILNDRQRLANLKHQIRANPSRLDYREQYAEELMARRSYLMAADQYRYIAQHRPERPREWLKVARALELGGERDLAAYLREFVGQAGSGEASSVSSHSSPVRRQGSPESGREASSVSSHSSPVRRQGSPENGREPSSVSSHSSSVRR